MKKFCNFRPGAEWILLSHTSWAMFDRWAGLLTCQSLNIGMMSAELLSFAHSIWNQPMWSKPQCSERAIIWLATLCMLQTPFQPSPTFTCPTFDIISYSRCVHGWPKEPHGPNRAASLGPAGQRFPIADLHQVTVQPPFIVFFLRERGLHFLQVFQQPPVKDPPLVRRKPLPSIGKIHKLWICSCRYSCCAKQQQFWNPIRGE